MSDTAITVQNLGKRYRISVRQEKYKTLRDTLTNVALSPVRAIKSLTSRNGYHNSKAESQNSKFDFIWALKDICFEVKRGEVVGIIGRNGAGKSTLLKILSRITEPTEGYADIHGRVGSLLEVGTGFHSELTGRENIYLNGSILGMKRTETERRFDEIVAFAEVESFIDTPVKYYSTGMYLRLAFAVAAHLEPEILIIDEVLAVGDAVFQKKCLGKMGDVARAGRTVLFVSHNMTAVENLCSRAIWLNDGRISQQGDVTSVVSQYLSTAAVSCVEQSWPNLQGAPGNEKVRLKSVRILCEKGKSPENINITTPFAIEVSYWNLKPNAALNLSLALLNNEGGCIFVSTTVNEPVWHGKPFPVGLYRSICHVPGGLLNSGLYKLRLSVVKDSAVVLYRHEDALVFEVHDAIDGRGSWFGKWPGAVRPSLDWSTELLESSVLESV